MHSLHSNGWNVHFNGDWSGDVIVEGRDGNGEREYRIPGHVFVAVAREIFGDLAEASRDLVQKLDEFDKQYREG